MWHVDPAQLNALNAELITYRTRLTTLITALHDKAEAKTREAAELTDAHAKLLDVHRQLLVEVGEMQQRGQEREEWLQSELRKYIAESQHWQARSAKLRKEIDELHQRLSNYDSETESLLTERRVLIDEANELRREVELLTSERDNALARPTVQNDTERARVWLKANAPGANMDDPVGELMVIGASYIQLYKILMPIFRKELDKVVRFMGALGWNMAEGRPPVCLGNECAGSVHSYRKYVCSQLPPDAEGATVDA
jgi:hypothetical protein